MIAECCSTHAGIVKSGSGGSGSDDRGRTKINGGDSRELVASKVAAVAVTVMIFAGP